MILKNAPTAIYGCRGVKSARFHSALDLFLVHLGVRNVNVTA
ncbi:hypothetical protein [Paenibacillus sp. RC67]|nr:hypothetical protein [Paenibacillus sp. RC67]